MAGRLGSIWESAQSVIRVLTVCKKKAKALSFSGQTERMPWLIWVLVGAKPKLSDLSHSRSSFFFFQMYFHMMKMIWLRTPILSNILNTLVSTSQPCRRYDMRCVARKPVRSYTNWAVHPQKIARGLKFWLEEEEGLYYQCSKNKMLISFAVTV